MIKYYPQQIFGFENHNRRIKKILQSDLDEAGKNSAFSMLMFDLLSFIESEEEQELIDERLDSIIESQSADREDNRKQAAPSIVDCRPRGE